MSKRSETYGVAKPAKPQACGNRVYDVSRFSWGTWLKTVLEKIEKWSEGVFHEIASLQSHFKERWVGTGCFYMQMYMNPVVLGLFVSFSLLIPEGNECKKLWEAKETKFQEGSWVGKGLCTVVFPDFFFIFSHNVPNEIEEVEM